MHDQRIKRVLYVLLAAILLISSFYLTSILLRAYTPTPPISSSVSTKPKKIENTTPLVKINPPVRLEITSINVSTVVKPVGMTTDGDMAIDGNINEVAWYEPGPKPGEKGNAVIAGHYGWKSGQPSVFNNLHTLQPGDKLSVYDANGSPVSFIVQKIQSYDPTADATEVFQSTDGKAHLNLITCEGSWESSQQTYSERLVVFTDKEV